MLWSVSVSARIRNPQGMPVSGTARASGLAQMPDRASVQVSTAGAAHWVVHCVGPPKNFWSLVLKKWPTEPLSTPGAARRSDTDVCAPAV